jgi:VanZ family protein
VHKNYYLSAALIWTCSILLLCLEPARELPKIEINNVDKLAHFVFHFVFVILWYLYFNSNAKIANYKAPVILFIVSVVFGIVIECSQQAFTTSRKGDVLDVISNISGAFSALILIFSVQYYSNNKKIG